MAFTALATANTTIGPVQYADMAQALAPRFLVDSPTDLQPSYSSGSVSVTTGAALIAGTRVRATGTNSVAIPAVSSGSKTYAVCLRVDWSKGASDSASLVAVNTTVNKGTSPVTASINRIPGVVYDALLCLVTRRSGSTAASNFQDYRTWGGDGGPLRVSDAAMESPSMLDARAGTFIQTDQGRYTKRLDNDGVWRAVGTDSNPWRMWTPTMRFYGKDIPNGTSGGTIATLGSNGSALGRYRIVDGMLDGYVSVNTGNGNQFGTGAITFDLPVACSNWQPDTWSMGHIFTSTTNGGDGNYDWHAEALIKAGWTRAMIWTNPRIDDNRLVPHKSSTNGGAGEGVPWINGGWSVGSIYTFHISYPASN